MTKHGWSLIKGANHSSYIGQYYTWTEKDNWRKYFSFPRFWFLRMNQSVEVWFSVYITNSNLRMLSVKNSSLPGVISFPRRRPRLSHLRSERTRCNIWVVDLPQFSTRLNLLNDEWRALWGDRGKCRPIWDRWLDQLCSWLSPALASASAWKSGGRFYFYTEFILIGIWWA